VNGNFGCFVNINRIPDLSTIEKGEFRGGGVSALTQKVNTTNNVNWQIMVLFPGGTVKKKMNLKSNKVNVFFFFFITIK